MCVVWTLNSLLQRFPSVAVDTYALLSSFDVRRRATGNKENVGSVLLFHASFITSSLFSLLAFQLLSLSLSNSRIWKRSEEGERHLCMCEWVSAFFATTPHYMFVKCHELSFFHFFSNLLSPGASLSLFSSISYNWGASPKHKNQSKL